MVAITVTPANVGVTDANTKVLRGQAGATIAQGEPVYLSGSTYLVALNSTAAEALVAGVAITPAASGEYFYFVTSGKMDLGATLVTGTVYAVGDTAGAINPVADLGSGDFVTVLGVATSAAEINVVINVSGVAIA